MRRTAAAMLTALLLGACIQEPELNLGPDGRLTSLAGTEWRLESLAGAPAPAEAWIAFEDERRVGGVTGCNHFGATYEFAGGRIGFEPGEMTEMACPGPAMQQEASFISALQRARRAGTSESRLVLISEDGTALATFTPRG